MSIIATTQCVQTSNIARICVLNVLHVLEYKVEDVNVIA